MMESAIFTSLGGMLQTLFPGVEVTRGLQNRVAMPKGAFINMTPLRQTRLATNETTYNGTSQKTLTNFKRFDVQVDFYGPSAADQANSFETVFRDDWACSALGPLTTPLYCADAVQGALTNEEKQYEARWIVVASVEFNPDTVLPQDFMNTAVVVPVNVEATYP